MIAKRNRGFTLIEVVVSLVILTGALLTVTMVWNGNTLRVRKSRIFNEVGFLLEKKMSRLFFAFL